MAYTYSLSVSFNANGGSGAPSYVSNSVTSSASTVRVSVTIPSTTPTKSGYTFNGWWYGGSRYNPSSTFSYTFSNYGDNQSKSFTLVANWVASASTWGSTPSSVSLDGTTSYTFNISKASAVDHHTVEFTLGAQTLTYTNVGTSKTVTFPTSWQAQIPNATSGSIVCTLTSYSASDAKIGSTKTKTITATIPSSVVPTLSITASRVNSNATVSGWNILLQGFSAISFTATASGAGGSTISSISFSGAGIQQTGTSTTATSDVLTVKGSQTWTITATDSRGRTATQTYTETVYDYSPPSISTASARRCTQSGTIDEATGTYALFSAIFAYSSANSHNTTTQKIESKLHSGSTWTTLANSYTSGTNATIGGSFDVDKTYDIRLTITDSLGNTATYSIFFQSVQGFALGLKNDRARFGGVPTKAGLTIDWEVSAPNFVQTGTVEAANVASNTTRSVSVVFDTAFASTPIVVATLNTTQNAEYGMVSTLVDSISTTGFTLRIVNNATQGKSVGATWIAVKG